MAFYNRENEIRRLKRALSSPTAKLVVLYGRRRCGKTTLINQILSKNDIYFMASQSDEAIQRTELANIIAEQVDGFDQVIYPNWEALFSNLNQRLNQKVTLCLDEFPYLVKSSESLPSIIQKMVDQADQRKFHLVLCGSSQQMMQGLVLDSTAPLYGRSDEIMKILPLDAGWIMDSINCSPIQAVQEYATWGGVPRYWELRQEFNNYQEAVTEIILDRLGVLREEPTRLFLDDMRESVQAHSLLALVGKGSNKLSEIAGRLNKPATHLSRPLSRLIQLGYLIREIPFGESTKSTKRSLYKIVDPFMNFYFSFVSPNLSRLEMGLTKQVYTSIAPKFNHFVANEWEHLSRKSIPIAPISDIHFGQAYRWWGNNIKGEMMELDIVAESIDKKYLLIGECKWTDVNTPEQLIRQLIEKGNLLPNKKGRKIIPALFVKSFQHLPSRFLNILSPDDVLSRLR